MLMFILMLYRLDEKNIIFLSISHHTLHKVIQLVENFTQFSVKFFLLTSFIKNIT
jgi:23S rRNA maturation-related 3'-5' exoribonuclease YhaM